MSNLEVNNLFSQLMVQLLEQAKDAYADNLLGILQFGSTVDSYLKNDTDIDLIIVLKQLPPRRRDRYDIFFSIEDRLQEQLKKLQTRGHSLYFSPIFRDEKRIRAFSPLLLDITEKSKILYDPQNILQQAIDKTRDWIIKSGAYKRQRGLKWFWVLSPNHVPGQINNLGF